MPVQPVLRLQLLAYEDADVLGRVVDRVVVHRPQIYRTRVRTTSRG